MDGYEEEIAKKYFFVENMIFEKIKTTKTTCRLSFWV